MGYISLLKNRQKDGDVDMGRKRIVFAMIEAGGGHKAPAVAIAEGLAELYETRYEIKIMDFMKETGCINLDRKHKETWNFFLAHPVLCRLSHRISDIAGILFRTGLKRIYLHSFYEYVYSFLKLYKPAIIFSTHPFNTIAIDYVRKKYNINVLLVNFLTELFDLTSLWVLKGVDSYIVTTQEAKDKLVRRGVPENKLRVFNYPVRKQFFERSQSKQQIAGKLSLDVFKKTLFISFGGQGREDPRRFIDAIVRERLPLNVVVITGKNKSLYTDLNEKYSHHAGMPNIVILGFAENIGEIMEISDICFIKPGPSTLMEEITLQKPIILYKAVQISEIANISFVLHKKIGFYAGENVKHFIDSLKNLLNDTYVEKIMENYKSLKIKNGAYDIAQFIANISEKSDSDFSESFHRVLK